MGHRVYLFACIILVTTSSFKTANYYNSNDSRKISRGSTAVDTLPYSTLCFYRSFIPKMNAPLKKVPIYINDSLVTELKANTGVIYKMFKEGKVNISIDSKGDSQFPFKVKFGKNYFFKCEVVKGLWFGKPTIEAVSEKIGREESGILAQN